MPEKNYGDIRFEIIIAFALDMVGIACRDNLGIACQDDLGIACQESVRVLGMELGPFEVAFVPILIAVMVISRVFWPWWQQRPAKLDREDFMGLVDAAEKVRAQQRNQAEADDRDKDDRDKQELDVHLKLLDVHFFGDDSRDDNKKRDLDLALLIKLMQRGDLEKAKEQFAKPT